MYAVIPQSAVQCGFAIEPVSIHTSRTIMLQELSTLMGASRPDAAYDELRRLVVDENVTLKRTDSTRRETFRRLRELYGLRRDLIVYRALRDLWSSDELDRPMLALLCAAARDPLLRSTAPAVLEQPEGATVTPQMLEEALQDTYPDRYSPIIRANIGRHAISSWAQAGHLSGRTLKKRARPVAGAAATAYALLLGHLCDRRGMFLFDTFWTRILDQQPSAIRSLAFAASQRGFLEYRQAGDVVQVGFSHLMRSDTTPEG